MSRLVDRSRQPRQATAPASAVVADGCWHATPFRLDPDGLKWAPPETEAGAAAVRVKSRQATGTTGIVLLLVTAAIVVAVRPGWLPWIGETGHTFGPRTASPGDRGRHFEPSIRRDSPSALVVAPAPSAPVAPPRVVEPAKPVPPPPVAAAPPPPVEAAPTPAPAAPQPPPAAAVVPRAPVPASSSNIETPPAGSIAPASVAPVATDSAPIKAPRRDIAKPPEDTMPEPAAPAVTGMVELARPAVAPPAVEETATGSPSSAASQLMRPAGEPPRERAAAVESTSATTAATTTGVTPVVAPAQASEPPLAKPAVRPVDRQPAVAKRSAVADKALQKAAPKTAAARASARTATAHGAAVDPSLNEARQARELFFGAGR